MKRIVSLLSAVALGMFLAPAAFAQAVGGQAGSAGMGPAGSASEQAPGTESTGPSQGSGFQNGMNEGTASPNGQTPSTGSQTGSGTENSGAGSMNNGAGVNGSPPMNNGSPGSMNNGANPGSMNNGAGGSQGSGTPNDSTTPGTNY
ncbi:MAG: hypothetical protein ACYCWW_02710 [Deltaproteobacteria bacterium]